MLFRMAQKLNAVKDQIPIDDNKNVEIDFEVDCVVTSNSRASAQSMIVGVRKISDDGAGRATFDINHRAEGSNDYIR